jgi:hypothetical protein
MTKLVLPRCSSHKVHGTVTNPKVGPFKLPVALWVSLFQIYCKKWFVSRTAYSESRSIFLCSGSHNDVWKFVPFTQMIALLTTVKRLLQYISRKETSTIISCPSEAAAVWLCWSHEYIDRTLLEPWLKNLPTPNPKHDPVVTSKNLDEQSTGWPYRTSQRNEIQRRLNSQDYRVKHIDHNGVIISRKLSACFNTTDEVGIEQSRNVIPLPW